MKTIYDIMLNNKTLKGLTTKQVNELISKNINSDNKVIILNSYRISSKDYYSVEIKDSDY